MKCWYDGKTVILTGASSGIGKELAKKLVADHGCTVLGIGRNEEKLAALKNELGERAPLLRTVSLDLCSEGCWNAVKAILNALSLKPDVLINCAGIMPDPQTFSKYSENPGKYIDDVYKTDLLSPVEGIRTFLPVLLESNTPAIINVSSSATYAPMAGITVYASAKSGLRAFTEALEQELHKKAYVCCVCPGFVKTDLFRDRPQAVPRFSITAEKAASVILKGMKKGKRKICPGADAKAYRLFYNLFGQRALDLFRVVLKNSRSSLFEKAFRQ